VFRCAKAAAPALTEAHGAIVNTASIAGLGRAGSSLAYSATKAGVVSLTQNLARALGPSVRVNAIAPGAVDSSWMIEWTDLQRQQSVERAVLKRRCQPEDLAEVILFLGFGAAMVTGQTITVDGGLIPTRADVDSPGFRIPWCSDSLPRRRSSPRETSDERGDTHHTPGPDGIGASWFRQQV
jgi:NAD(P)-dependent dehydrogenase (short-subunit alcohol dehydrogenase family)